MALSRPTAVGEICGQRCQAQRAVLYTGCSALLKQQLNDPRRPVILRERHATLRGFCLPCSCQIATGYNRGYEAIHTIYIRTKSRSASSKTNDHDSSIVREKETSPQLAPSDTHIFCLSLEPKQTPNMRFEVAVLAAAATLFAPIQAQTGDVRVAALAYTGIFAEDDPICYGDLITTVNVYEHRDGTCHAATGAECITTVALDPGAICWLKSFGDSACTESLQEEHLGNDYLVYDHVPARNSFQIWCYP